MVVIHSCIHRLRANANATLHSMPFASRVTAARKFIDNRREAIARVSHIARASASNVDRVSIARSIVRSMALSAAAADGAAARDDHERAPDRARAETSIDRTFPQRVFSFPCGANEDGEHEARREPAGARRKARGFAYFAQLGSPRYHVAPMVDQSELAFRELCRRYGATLAYTPMIHARLFVESEKYRREIFSTTLGDRPLLAQFCANDPEILIKAATMIAPYCDGVDINFGCPQRIAKRGNYGAYLMDDWKTVEALIRKLDEELPVPVTAKIRVYDDLETTLKYAKMVEAAGAQIVAVHGRTREQKRCAEYRANWAFIKRIKEELKIPVLANGDVRSFAEAQACLEATGADGVLSAEPLLSNPALFSNPPFYPPPADGFAPIPLDGTAAADLLIEYLHICKHYTAPFSSIRGHIWRLVGHWLSELTDFRDELAKVNGNSVTLDDLIDWTSRLKNSVLTIETIEGRRRPIPKKSQRALEREAAEEARQAAIAEANREAEALNEIGITIEDSSEIERNKRQRVETQPATA